MLTSLTGSIIGHVGDGNFHTLLLVDPNDPREVTEAKQLADTMARYVHSHLHCTAIIDWLIMHSV